MNDILEAVPSRWGLVAYTSFRTSLGRQYLAFVHSPGAEPALVSMGDAAAVDQHVIRWSRDLVSTPLEDGVQAKRVEAAARESGRAVRRLIWDPVVAALGDVEGVIIVPEGTINGVNFAALPGPGVEYLAERPMVFHYVTSELDIPARGSRKHGTGLLAFGGIDFGAPTRRAATRAAGDEDCQGFYASAFPQLPQSRLEVEEIAAAWPESSSLDVLTGARATESAFKRLAPGKRVLHLATHGFFLDPSHCQSTEAVDRRGIRVDLSVRIPKRKSLYQESPLLLSGLALAGANRRSEATPIGEDGVLTAEEVASLDLRGVDWAVLSACDTGIAGSAPGDGVLGLRRAFRTAGVATLIVSLWPVQDQAAREWMGKFYRNRNQSGVDTARAARAAMLEMLRNRRAHGRSTSPFYWAAFLAAGDWN